MEPTNGVYKWLTELRLIAIPGYITILSLGHNNIPALLSVIAIYSIIHRSPNYVKLYWLLFPSFLELFLNI